MDFGIPGLGYIKSAWHALIDKKETPPSIPKAQETLQGMSTAKAGESLDKQATVLPPGGKVTDVVSRVAPLGEEITSIEELKKLVIVGNYNKLAGEFNDVSFKNKEKGISYKQPAELKVFREEMKRRMKEDSQEDQLRWGRELLRGENKDFEHLKALLARDKKGGVDKVEEPEEQDAFEESLSEQSWAPPVPVSTLLEDVVVISPEDLRGAPPEMKKTAGLGWRILTGIASAFGTVAAKIFGGTKGTAAVRRAAPQSAQRESRVARSILQPSGKPVSEMSPAEKVLERRWLAEEAKASIPDKAIRDGIENILDSVIELYLGWHGNLAINKQYTNEVKELLWITVGEIINKIGPERMGPEFIDEVVSTVLNRLSDHMKNVAEAEGTGEVLSDEQVRKNLQANRKLNKALIPTADMVFQALVDAKQLDEALLPMVEDILKEMKGVKKFESMDVFASATLVLNQIRNAKGASLDDMDLPEVERNAMRALPDKPFSAEGLRRSIIQSVDPVLTAMVEKGMLSPAELTHALDIKMELAVKHQLPKDPAEAAKLVLEQLYEKEIRKTMPTRDQIDDEVNSLRQGGLTDDARIYPAAVLSMLSKMLEAGHLTDEDEEILLRDFEGDLEKSLGVPFHKVPSKFFDELVKYKVESRMPADAKITEMVDHAALRKIDGLAEEMHLNPTNEKFANLLLGGAAGVTEPGVTHLVRDILTFAMKMTIQAVSDPELVQRGLLNGLKAAAGEGAAEASTTAAEPAAEPVEGPAAAPTGALGIRDKTKAALTGLTSTVVGLGRPGWTLSGVLAPVLNNYVVGKVANRLGVGGYLKLARDRETILSAVNNVAALLEGMKDPAWAAARPELKGPSSETPLSEQLQAEIERLPEILSEASGGWTSGYIARGAGVDEYVKNLGQNIGGATRPVHMQNLLHEVYPELLGAIFPEMKEA